MMVMKNCLLDVGYEKLNRETMTVMDEAEKMEKSGDYGKAYNDVDEMMKDILLQSRRLSPWHASGGMSKGHRSLEVLLLRL